MNIKHINTAIDGFSSCGKSSIAKEISKNFDMIYVDSGAMYRAVTLFCLENDIISNSKVIRRKLIEKLCNIEIEFNFNKQTNLSEILLNGINVEHKIRSRKVSEYVSKISQIPEVRNKLIKIQQKICENRNVVMDGRDIATMVMPNADLKFFITADIKIRARRRFDELKSVDKEITYADVLNNLSERDNDDVKRKHNPLIKAADAIVIDNTSLNFAQQNELIFRYIKDAKS